MRISDWSSDVCLPIWRLRCLDPKVAGSYCPASRAPLPPKYFLGVTVNQAWGQIATELYCVAKKHHRAAATIAAHSARSEEHKSELQSLMRISYAVSRL